MAKKFRSRRSFLSGFLVYLVLASLLVFPLDAFAGDYEDLIEKGKSDLREMKYSAAEESFRSALELEPDGFEAVLHLGITLSRAGKTKEAESMLKKALLIDPESPVAQLEIGKVYKDKEVTDEAVDFFESVVDLAPKTDYAREAQKLLKALEGEEKGVKPWSLAVSAGLQYDSNVLLISDDTTLPEGITDESDWRFVATLGGNYELYRGERITSILGYSLYQSIHEELNEYDVQAHGARAAATFKIRDDILLRGMYNFSYVLVDNEDYNFGHSVSPALFVIEKPGMFTAVEYKYTYSDYEDSESFPTNSERTGDTHEAGLTQAVPILGIVNLKAGAGYEFATADEEYYDYVSYKGNLSLSFDLPFNHSVSLSGEYETKEYDENNPQVSDISRDDDTQTYSLSVSKDILSWLSITLSQLFIINDSNIESYQYDRSVSSAVLTARF